MHNVNKIKMQRVLTAVDRIYLKARLCSIAVACFVFWVSNDTVEMCKHTNRCRVCVAKRPTTVQDGWRANENNNLSSPSLALCPFSLSFSFNYKMRNVFTVKVTVRTRVSANLVSLSLLSSTLISNLDE